MPNQKQVPGSGPTGEAGQEQISAAHIEHEGLDALLDDIDAVLEDNAESFVQGFVQKGGQ
ncbi:MAG: ubiquitin-like protein Pup [Flaviflexus sp.]|nr:ubiquitin-like protein Pup [Flaviflexus sp.]